MFTYQFDKFFLGYLKFYKIHLMITCLWLYKIDFFNFGLSLKSSFNSYNYLQLFVNSFANVLTIEWSILFSLKSRIKIYNYLNPFIVSWIEVNNLILLYAKWSSNRVIFCKGFRQWVHKSVSIISDKFYCWSG